MHIIMETLREVNCLTPLHNCSSLQLFQRRLAINSSVTLSTITAPNDGLTTSPSSLSPSRPQPSSHPSSMLVRSFFSYHHYHFSSVIGGGCPGRPIEPHLSGRTRIWFHTYEPLESRIKEQDSKHRPIRTISPILLVINRLRIYTHKHAYIHTQALYTYMLTQINIHTVTQAYLFMYSK